MANPNANSSLNSQSLSGDILPVPETTTSTTTASPLLDSDHGTTDQVKLVTNFVYLLVGMGMVAMCYYLLKEEVLVRVARTKDRLKEKILKCKERIKDRRTEKEKARTLLQ